MASRELAVKITGDASGLRRAFRDADAAAGGFASRLGRIGTIAASALGGLAAGIGIEKVFQSTVGAAADLETELSKVKAAAGATTGQMNALRDAALKAAQHGVYSATQVAEAETALAKAGRTAGQIIRRDLTAALALAHAGTLDVGDAAEYTSNIMGVFGDKIKRATQIADTLTVAANTTTADVKDFAEALEYAGAAAKAGGEDFLNTTTMLEALAKMGIKGSLAGTAVRSAMVQLVHPSRQAADLMKQLGINMFDSNGRMKDAVGMSEALQKGFAGLTAKQRLSAASTIASTRGMNLLLALYDAGPKTIAKYRRELDAQGTAEKQSAQLTDNFHAKLQILQNSLQVAGIKLGDRFLPRLTELVHVWTGKVNRLDIDAIGNKIQGAFDAAGGAVKTALPILQDAFAVLRPLGSAMRTVAGAAADFARTDLGKMALTAAGSVYAAKRLLGGATSLLPGKAGGVMGGAATATMTVKAGVVNVIGGAGGIPGVPGGGGGAAGGAEAAARKWGIPAGGFALMFRTLGATGMAGAAAAYGATKAEGAGLIPWLPSDADVKRQMDAIQTQIIQGFRRLRAGSKGSLQDNFRDFPGVIADALTGNMGGHGMVQQALARKFVPAVDELGKQAARAVDAFTAAIRTGRGKAATSAQAVQAAALRGLRGLPKGAEMLAADSMIQMAATLENKGKLPAGATTRLVHAIESRFGELPGVTKSIANTTMAGFVATLAGYAGAMSAVGSQLGNAFGASWIGTLASAGATGMARLRGMITGGGGSGKAAPHTQRAKEFGAPGGRTPWGTGWGSGGPSLLSQIITAQAGAGGLTLAGRIDLTNQIYDLGAGARQAQARKRGEAAARKAGLNEQQISDSGDLAVLKVQQKDLTVDQARVKAGISRLRPLVAKAKKALEAARAARRKIPTGKKHDKAREAATQRVAAAQQNLQGLYGQLAGLLQESAENQAQARELGLQIADAKAQITADATPPPPPTASDRYAAETAQPNAELALAALTPDTGDDLAALRKLAGITQTDLNAALAAPNKDWAWIAELAGNLKSLNDSITQLTTSTDQNTDAVQASTQTFTGQTTFTYRGQSYGLASLGEPSSDRMVNLAVGV